MNTDKNNLRLAVLIDAENLNPSTYKTILNEIKKHGELVIKRIYGNLNNLKSWKTVIDEHAFKSFYIANTKSKNGSDIAMVVDAMDLLLNNNVDGFCIVSSDSDFTHLAVRMRETGKFVLGFGEEKSLPVLRNACNDFIVLDNTTAQKTAEEKAYQNKPDDNQSTIDKVKNIIELLPSKEGWINLGVLGKKLKEKSMELTFDGKKHQLRSYLKLSTNHFELDSTEQKVKLKS